MFLAKYIRDKKSHFKALSVVQPWVAACFVAATVSSAEQPTPLNPQAQGFGPASEPGPFGINWVLETPQAGSGEIIQAGGGVLCLKLKGDANDLFVLRPAERPAGRKGG